MIHLRVISRVQLSDRTHDALFAAGYLEMAAATIAPAIASDPRTWTTAALSELDHTTLKSWCVRGRMMAWSTMTTKSYVRLKKADRSNLIKIMIQFAASLEVKHDLTYTKAELVTLARKEVPNCKVVAKDRSQLIDFIIAARHPPPTEEHHHDDANVDSGEEKKITVEADPYVKYCALISLYNEESKQPGSKSRAGLAGGISDTGDIIKWARITFGSLRFEVSIRGRVSDPSTTLNRIQWRQQLVAFFTDERSVRDSLLVLHIRGHVTGKGYLAVPRGGSDDKTKPAPRRINLNTVLTKFSGTQKQRPASMPVQRLLILIQACHSGVWAEQLRAHHRDGHHTNVAVQTACDADEKSNDDFTFTDNWLAYQSTPTSKWNDFSRRPCAAVASPNMRFGPFRLYHHTAVDRG